MRSVARCLRRCSARSSRFTARCRLRCSSHRPRAWSALRAHGHLALLFPHATLSSSLFPLAPPPMMGTQLSRCPPADALLSPHRTPEQHRTATPRAPPPSAIPEHQPGATPEHHSPELRSRATRNTLTQHCCCSSLLWSDAAASPTCNAPTTRSRHVTITTSPSTSSTLSLVYSFPLDFFSKRQFSQKAVSAPVL